MTRRYIVLDQNVLRAPTLADLLADPKVHFVLPDLAFLEMTKKNWELTLRQSLVLIGTVRNRVHVASSVDEALKTELDTVEPVRHMLHYEATDLVRDLLQSFQLNIGGRALEIFHRKCDENVAMMSEGHLGHAANKLQFLGLIDALSVEIREQLRRGQLTEEQKLEHIHAGAKEISKQILLEKGVNFQKAKMFIKRRPLLLRYILVNIWYTCELTEKGNFEIVKDMKFTNDAIDRHYVLTASFFDNLLTNDKRMKAAFNGLICLLAMKY